MSKKTYTEQQVKNAFWRVFHKCGVVFFSYLDSEHDNEEGTNGHWREFLEELRKELDE